MILFLLALEAVSVVALILGFRRLRQAIGDRDADGAFIGAILACAGLVSALTVIGPGFLGGLR